MWPSYCLRCVSYINTTNHKGLKKRKHLRGSTQATILPLARILTVALKALVSGYNSLGKYCGPHTVYSVFLKLILGL